MLYIIAAVAVAAAVFVALSAAVAAALVVVASAVTVVPAVPVADRFTMIFVMAQIVSSGPTLATPRRCLEPGVGAARAGHAHPPHFA